MVQTMKLTARQEAFCQTIVNGLNQTEAYKFAGYAIDNKLPATVHQAASRLAANSKVAARILELRSAVRAHSVWSTERLLAELEANLENAQRDRKFHAANKALWQIGKVTGLL